VLFPLKGGAKQVYFLSYKVELSSTDIANLKQYLLYNPNLIRYEIFARNANQDFFHFDTLQTVFQQAIEDIKEKKYGQKVDFFTHKANEKYLNWKSVVILKYYLTRFGDIKPRIYTGNSVKIQKKLRTEILRARGFGLLPFISK
jgi:ribosomal protein S18